MKLKKISKLIWLSFLLISLSCGIPLTVRGAENGEVVPSEGVVTFYEEETFLGIREKPPPRLPQTSEGKSARAKLLGFLLVSGGVTLIIWRRNLPIEVRR